MPELRLNLITREWVIVAREKGKKPEDFIGARERKRLPEFVDTCPFCPGNEAKTPDEKYREVIIETPAHNLTTATMPVEQLKEVIQTYKDHFVEIYNDCRIEHVIIFKNNGPASGTTIEHPHSQIVGVPVTPLQIRSRIENSMRYFDDTGECLLCNTLNDEMNDGSRILCNTEHFVSFVPYAALSAFHIWIFPKRHSGSFSDIRPEEMWDLAINLKKTMSKLYYGLDHPDFNYVLRSGKPGNSSSEFIHWYISIVPRVAMASGFELGSGMYINPLVPEVSAGFLRGVRIPE